MSEPKDDFDNFMRNIHNDGHPDYDEDAAVCLCGHTFRDHHGRAFNYACADRECGCAAFREAALDAEARRA